MLLCYCEATPGAVDAARVAWLAAKASQQRGSECDITVHVRQCAACWPGVCPAWSSPSRMAAMDGVAQERVRVGQGERACSGSVTSTTGGVCHPLESGLERAMRCDRSLR